MLAQLAINHLVARRSGEVQAGVPIFRALRARTSGPRNRDTGGRLIRLRPAKGRSGPSCGSNTDEGGPGVLADPGPFPWVLFGASSAREHQHDDEAGGDNCGLQIQRQREVGGGLRNSRKVVMLLSGRRVCGGPSP